jgi:hypothetical protein
MKTRFNKFVLIIALLDVLVTTHIVGRSTGASITKVLDDPNPVAAFTVTPSEAACYQIITFDASASYHTSPTRSIVGYEWDFDAASENDFQVDAVGIKVTHAYPKFGAFNAWLRVTDDQGLTGITSQIVNVDLGNLPPIADAGGPYITTLGISVILDGQGSVDPNMPCDWIGSYLWDINDDDIFGDLTGPTPTLIVESGSSFHVGMSYRIGLLVTDSFGLLSNVSETTLQIQQAVTIELSSFSALVNDSFVLLNWRTETETNNYGFEIERRTNNKDKSLWEKIGFVEGHGNSNSPKEYSYTDKNPYGCNTFQYRLKQIDNDGQFIYSGEVEIELLPNQYDLMQNYPNPFNPTTTIGFGILEKGNVRLSVLNVLGEEIRLLLNEEMEADYHSIEFNASDLPSAVYFYRIQSGNFIDTKKMLLLK